MIILSNVWLQVIIFLIVAPLILIVSACWLLIFNCYNKIQKSDKMRSVSRQICFLWFFSSRSSSPSYRVPTQLMTLYAPEAPARPAPPPSTRSRLSDKFGKSESVPTQRKVHTATLEIDVKDRKTTSSGSHIGNPGKERRRITSGTLSEKYSPNSSRSYINDESDLIVDFPMSNWLRLFANNLYFHIQFLLLSCCETFIVN